MPTNIKIGRLKLPNTLAVWFTGLVVLAGLISWPFINRGGPDLPSICFISSILALASLVSIWCAVLGGWKAYLIGVPALLLDGLALTSTDGPGDLMWLLMLLPLGIAVPSCLTVEMIKFMFGEFSKLLAGNQDFEEGLQFKLSHMFITTTVIAVLCGIGQAVGWNSLGVPAAVAWSLAVIVVVLALLTLITIWAVLGKSLLFRLSIVFPAAIGISGIGVYCMDQHGHAEIWGIIFGVCFISMLTFLSLLRWEGYRFVLKALPAV